MKKLSVLILLFSAVVCHGEIVSEVSFNPSRMGDYRYLKVADSASLVGGLVTNDLNISSGETVIMKLDSTAPQSFNISGGGTAETNPRSVDGASGSAIDMPSTVFRGSSSAYIPNVYVRGGEGTFTGGNSVVDNTMNGNYVLLQKAKTLSGGAVEIAGDASKATIDLHSAGSTAGFWLHGNDIPNPKRSASLEGATSISSCTLKWEERTTAETTPKKVRVLSLANCTTGSSSTPPSGGGESKFSCGTVYEKAKQTFRYTDAFGHVNCLNAQTGTCPSHIVPGVKMNMEHGGLDCTYQAYCPWSGYTGQTYEGYIIKLGLKNTGETCTADQVVWL